MVESAAAERPRARASALDGLRALCAFGVIFYHLGFGWCQGGLHGVTILFVLTGYLTTTGLLRTYERTGKLGIPRFWGRRLWRLMPSALAYVAVTAALCVLFDHVLLTKLRTDAIPAIFMYINWEQILSQVSYFNAAGQASPVTHFWSLAVEAQFYLAWPLILAIMLRITKRRGPLALLTVVLMLASALAMALLYVPGQDPTRVYYGTDTRAMSMLAGSALALIWPLDRKMAAPAASYGWLRRIPLELVSLLSVAVLVAAMLLLNGTDDYNYFGGMLLLSLIAAVAAATLVVPGTLAGRLLSAPPLRWLGQRSYALYLWHFSILELLNPLNVTTTRPWWIYVLQIALVVVVADLSYRFVEEPLRKGFCTPGRRRGVSVASHGLGSWAISHKASVACICLLVPVAAFAARGLATIEPVNALGDNPNDQVVVHASLKKPLAEGVYDVVLVGDSVSLGANKQLNAEFPHGLIDSQGSRQLDAGFEALQGYLDQGVVGDTVIISLGTNGYLTEDGLDQVMDACGPDRTVWFVNVRGPYTTQYDANNAAIDACVAKHDNAKLIDWHARTEGHDELVGPDGIHLTEEGREAYAKLVYDTIGYVPPSEEDTRYDLLLIGDGLPMSVAQQLADAFPKGAIDTAEGRTSDNAADSLESYEEQGVVGDKVVVALDDMTEVSSDALERMVSSLGEGQTLYLVTCRFPGDQCAANNKAFAEAAAAHDNVRLIDWYGQSKGHDDYLRGDGLNLTERGSDAYIKLIVTSIESEKNQS